MLVQYGMPEMNNWKQVRPSIIVIPKRGKQCRDAIENCNECRRGNANPCLRPLVNILKLQAIINPFQQEGLFHK